MEEQVQWKPTKMVAENDYMESKLVQSQPNFSQSDDLGTSKYPASQKSTSWWKKKGTLGERIGSAE